MPDVKNCLTCGWGVKWEYGWDDRLHGICQFAPSIPVPRHWMLAIGFSEKSPPEENCPAWKKQGNPDAMQQWLESPLAYLKRINDGIKSALAEYESRQKLLCQCLCCKNEPEWIKERSGRSFSGTCKAGMRLWRPVADSATCAGVLVNDEFLSASCPHHQPKTKGGE